jgi:RNA polymerase sigma-70 factor (ECF subfamily)
LIGTERKRSLIRFVTIRCEVTGRRGCLAAGATAGRPPATRVVGEADVGRMERGETKPNGTDADAWSALLARAQDGDRSAYRRLLEEVTPYLRSLAAKHRVLSGETEDVVQDILLTLHTVRHTYDPSRPFRPWLVAIASRRIVDRLRRRGTIATFETALGPEHETIAATGPNLYALLSGRRGLRNAIQSLPSGQRQAVLLLKLRGLSLKEAALESGMSVAALKVASHRGLKALRVMLGKGT